MAWLRASADSRCVTGFERAILLANAASFEAGEHDKGAMKPRRNYFVDHDATDENGES